MAKCGAWMLDKLVLNYCDIGGSSRGMRLFLNEALSAFKAQNPQLEVEEAVRRHRHPRLVALYRNGRSKPVCVKNQAPTEIMEELQWLRNSHGRSKEYQVVRCRHLTRNPSIQGLWQVNTFAAQLAQENERRQARTTVQTQF